MRSLIRSQAQLAAFVCAAAAALLGGIALAGAELPQLNQLRAFGIPLFWLLLGVLIYPALLALAWFAIHHAERNETAFTELTKRR